MAEYAVVRGTVIGDDGVPIAGWASLGADEPQRWLAHQVCIRTDAGQEITLEDLGAETITPVHRIELRWRDIEQDPVGHLCSRDAPAPDIEFELHDAILRGGDVVVAWGLVTEHGYVAPPASAATSGDAFRGTAERGIKRLAARVVASGEHREELVETGRARYEERERKAAQADRETRAAGVASSSSKAAAPARTRDPDYTDRMAWNVPLAVALLGFGLVALIAGLTRAWGEGLRAAGVVACIPLAFDAVLIPRFRKNGLRPRSLEVPFIAFVVASLLVLMLCHGFAVGDFHAGRARGARIFQVIFLVPVVASAGVLWLVTRERLRWIGLLVRAPRHPHPVLDGVWGASDGHFATEVYAVGEEVEAWGMATKDAAGIKQRNVSTRPFTRVEHSAELRTAHGTLRVPVADADLLALARLDRSTGTDKGVRADVINARTPVRVVGRAQQGSLVRGGQASLILFAGPVDSNDVALTLRRLYRRLLLGPLLAALGVAAIVASYLV